jgi:hypothetical protein
VEGEAGQDGSLGGGIETLNIGGRVGLGVTERRRLVERLVPGQVVCVDQWRIPFYRLTAGESKEGCR